MNNLNVNLSAILDNINNDIVHIILNNYENNNYFYTWITDSDWDFKYIYEIHFKKYFIDYFTVETELILSYYAQNLSYVLETFVEETMDINKIVKFISTFIKIQFKTFDISTLMLKL